MIPGKDQIEPFTIKGFAIDDRHPKSGGSVRTKRYFRGQLRCIRGIGLSERTVYRKTPDICATASGYDVTAHMSDRFFVTVQNDLPWAIHRLTATEVICPRVDAGKANGGPSSGRARPAARCRKVYNRLQKPCDQRQNRAVVTAGVGLPGGGLEYGAAMDPDDDAGLPGAPGRFIEAGTASSCGMPARSRQGSPKPTPRARSRHTVSCRMGGPRVALAGWASGLRLGANRRPWMNRVYRIPAGSRAA